MMGLKLKFLKGLIEMNKKKKGFFIKYFDDFFGSIFNKIEVLAMIPTVILPLAILIITISKFYTFQLFWIIFGVSFLILAEIIYLQFAKHWKGSLIGWKIAAVFGALHIIALWLFLPFWIIKWLTKVPYNKIWIPCSIVISIVALVLLYFWINVMIGKKVRK